MAYCVNCGVLLDDGALKCVLCDTAVIIPEKNSETAASPAYPERLVIPDSVRKRYTVFLISVILFIPNIICVIINILMPDKGLWSVYVVSSSLFVWLIIAVPMMLKKMNPYIILTAYTISALLYAYVFYLMLHKDNWYVSLAVPFIITFSLCCFIFIAWVRKQKRGKLSITAMLLADIAIFSLLTEALINIYYKNENLFFVSVIISVSCICLMLFFRATEKNERLKAWMTRRFYF